MKLKFSRAAGVLSILALASLFMIAWFRSEAHSNNIPGAPIYALDSDNTLYTLRGHNFDPIDRIVGFGNLTGIDVRPATGDLYAINDRSEVFKLTFNTLQPFFRNRRVSPITVTKVADISPRFAAGYQSLMDFNPVVNALRLIGSNDQNFALVNQGGDLNVTAVQTALAYAATDVNAGVDPNIAAGAYTNNYRGAPLTLFYAIDYDLDNLVTILPTQLGGSSATGGGQLRTIGPVVDQRGNRVNFSPLADFDIFTSRTGQNTAVGISGRTLFTIDVEQVVYSLPFTSGQMIKATGFTLQNGANFVDVAITPQQP